MKLSPEKQKKFALSLMVVIGLAFSLYYFGIYMFLSQKQIKDTNELNKLTEEAKKTRDAIQTEKSNRENAKVYQVYLARKEEQMPKGNPETWLVKQISEYAEKQKLRITNTLIEPIADLSDFKFRDQPYKLIGFRFSFKGELNQAGKLIEDLENSMPLLEVDELVITAGSEIAPHIHTISVRISMVTKA